MDEGWDGIVGEGWAWDRVMGRVYRKGLDSGEKGWGMDGGVGIGNRYGD